MYKNIYFRISSLFVLLQLFAYCNKINAKEYRTEDSVVLEEDSRDRLPGPSIFDYRPYSTEPLASASSSIESSKVKRGEGPNKMKTEEYKSSDPKDSEKSPTLYYEMAGDDLIVFEPSSLGASPFMESIMDQNIEESGELEATASDELSSSPPEGTASGISASDCISANDKNGVCTPYRSCYPVVFDGLGTLKNHGLARMLYQASGPCGASKNKTWTVQTVSVQVQPGVLSHVPLEIPVDFYNHSVCCPGYYYFDSALRPHHFPTSAEPGYAELGAAPENIRKLKHKNKKQYKNSNYNYDGEGYRSEVEMPPTNNNKSLEKKLPLKPSHPDPMYSPEGRSLSQMRSNIHYRYHYPQRPPPLSMILPPHMFHSNFDSPEEEGPDYLFDHSGHEYFGTSPPPPITPTPSTPKTKKPRRNKFRKNKNSTLAIQAKESLRSEIKINAKARNATGNLTSISSASPDPPHVSAWTCPGREIVGMPRGHWPWMVALLNEGSHFCSGSLIDHRHVITSASCVANFQGKDIGKIRAILGDRILYSPEDGGHVWRKILRITRHLHFTPESMDHDIAILELDRDVSYTPNIQPINLPATSQKPSSNQKALVSGWSGADLGKRFFSARTATDVVVQFMENDECHKKYEGFMPTTRKGDFICTKPNEDTCRADLGAPLMIKTGNCWHAIGVLSHGLGCGTYFPHIFTDTASHLEWVQKNTKLRVGKDESVVS